MSPLTSVATALSVLDEHKRSVTAAAAAILAAVRAAPPQLMPNVADDVIDMLLGVECDDDNTPPSSVHRLPPRAWAPLFVVNELLVTVAGAPGGRGPGRPTACVHASLLDALPRMLQHVTRAAKELDTQATTAAAAAVAASAEAGAAAAAAAATDNTSELRKTKRVTAAHTEVCSQLVLLLEAWRTAHLLSADRAADLIDAVQPPSVPLHADMERMPVGAMVTCVTSCQPSYAWPVAPAELLRHPPKAPTVEPGRLHARLAAFMRALDVLEGGDGSSAHRAPNVVGLGTGTLNNAAALSIHAPVGEGSGASNGSWGASTGAPRRRRFAVDDVDDGSGPSGSWRGGGGDTYTGLGYEAPHVVLPPTSTSTSVSGGVGGGSKQGAPATAPAAVPAASATSSNASRHKAANAYLDEYRRSIAARFASLS